MCGGDNGGDTLSPARKWADLGTNQIQRLEFVFRAQSCSVSQFSLQTLRSIFRLFSSENEERVKMKCDPSSSAASRIWALSFSSYVFFFKGFINHRCLKFTVWD